MKKLLCSFLSLLFLLSLSSCAFVDRLKGDMGKLGYDENNNLLGIITDGDLRRMLEKNTHIADVVAADIMSKNPKTISRNELAIKAFEQMEKNSITQLVVTDGGKYLGMIHLHDLLKEGIV